MSSFEDIFDRLCFRTEAANFQYNLVAISHRDIVFYSLFLFINNEILHQRVASGTLSNSNLIPRT
jgi:hypothetical protein